ncbi:recombinase family protein [Flavobacterium sp. ZT3R25]|uniref:recombinase family protein n=1 Tax=Flavobacterium galactosi TaxID=3398735 RepID=UPI003A853E72
MRLQKFVSKYYKTVDYLLVDQMDRFSRNAGEALTMIKDLQKKYRIQVVSVTEGITFDYEIPSSFFQTLKKKSLTWDLTGKAMLLLRKS